MHATLSPENIKSVNALARALVASEIHESRDYNDERTAWVHPETRPAHGPTMTAQTAAAARNALLDALLGAA